MRPCTGPTFRRSATRRTLAARCAASPTRPPNVNALFAATVARHGTREALVTAEHRLDYAKLDRVTERLAGHLHRLGVARGDRVALVLGNGREFVYAYCSRRFGSAQSPYRSTPASSGPSSRSSWRNAARRRSCSTPCSPSACPRVRRRPCSGSARRTRAALTASMSSWTRARPPRRARRPRRGAARRHPLHVRHDRAAERRDAHASQPDPLGAALPRLHAAHARRPVAARRAREPRHRAGRDHARDVREWAVA